MHQATERVAIITGAVGNLGAATAQAFQTEGDKTVLVDRSPDPVRDAFASLVTSSGHFLAGGVDLSDAASLDKLVADTLARFGRIDVLVNTVGAWRGGKPVHETELADWDFLFNVWPRTPRARSTALQSRCSARGEVEHTVSPERRCSAEYL